MFFLFVCSCLCPFGRKCALSGQTKTCKHRIKFGDSSSYYYVSPYCRYRVSVTPSHPLTPESFTSPLCPVHLSWARTFSKLLQSSVSTKTILPASSTIAVKVRKQLWRWFSARYCTSTWAVPLHEDKNKELSEWLIKAAMPLTLSLTLVMKDETIQRHKLLSLFILQSFNLKPQVNVTGAVVRNLPLWFF